MMKEEFEKLNGQAISNADWETIEFVYIWHPSISETDGKQQIVDLYKNGGMLVIKGMVEAATYARELNIERQEYESKIRRIKQRLIIICSGDLDFERCSVDIRKYFDLATDMKEYEKFKSIFIAPKYSEKNINIAEEELGIAVLR